MLIQGDIAWQPPNCINFMALSQCQASSSMLTLYSLVCGMRSQLPQNPQQDLVLGTICFSKIAYDYVQHRKADIHRWKRECCWSKRPPSSHFCTHICCRGWFLPFFNWMLSIFIYKAHTKTQLFILGNRFHVLSSLHGGGRSFWGAWWLSNLVGHRLSFPKFGWHRACHLQSFNVGLTVFGAVLAKPSARVLM